MRHVDLCSGIGGFALGFQWAGLSEPVLFCDIEAWSRQVLAKHWPDVPIAEDVKELASDPRRLVPDCDILTAGYPCQPFSVAGQQRGAADDRHIWPEIFTIVQAKRPRWCVFENVSGHISLGLDQVLSDLEGENYAVQPFVVPACAVDAPHRRDRIWIIAAHTDSDGEPDVTINAESGCWELGEPTSNDSDTDSQRSHRAEQHQHGSGQPTDRQERELGSVRKVLAGRGNAAEWPAQNVGHTDSGDIARHDQTAQQGRRQQGLATGCEDVADANGERLQGQRAKPSRISEGQRDLGDSCRRVVEPSMGGMADGLSTWLDEPRDIPRVATGVKQRAARLKGLGNAIVPQIAMQIGLTIKAVEHG
jgi:DNA (cytosine-5)-methyltransferase 1